VTLEPLRRLLGNDLVNSLHERIRPDLGATPSVATKRNLILYGPPGTGKTHIAKAVARVLTGDTEGGSEGQFRIVQFHPSYSYEDFIQGLKPDLTKTELRYALGKGPFLRIVEDAKNDPNAFYVLVIDEVNRGDPARIFGELLYALEYRDEPVTLPGGGELVVPSNLVIIGTMNSVDRSVALVDYALRRRFGFIRVDPNPETIEQVHGDTTLGNGGAIVLSEFNAWLAKRLDREHVLGHSYFLGGTLDPNSPNTFEQVWSLDVRPLLEEYFFGDGDALKEAAAQWKAAVAMALSEDEEAAE
jgi:5-methylcytosine-specific restriction protein B